MEVFLRFFPNSLFHFVYISFFFSFNFAVFYSISFESSFCQLVNLWCKRFLFIFASLSVDVIAALGDWMLERGRTVEHWLGGLRYFARAKLMARTIWFGVFYSIFCTLNAGTILFRSPPSLWCVSGDAQFLFDSENFLVLCLLRL